MNNVRKVIVGLLAAVMLGASAGAITVSKATTATLGTAANYTHTAQSISPIFGGSVYNLTVTATTSTGKWAGLEGNVTSVTLSLNPTGQTVAFYSWSPLTLTNASLLLATTNSSPRWSTLVAGSAANTDTAWSFTGSDADSAASTFTGTNGITVAGTTAATVTVDTNNGAGVADWTTHIANLIVGASSKPYLVFAGNLTAQGGISTWDGNSSRNFQMMIPNNNDNGAGAADTYYLFVQK